MGDSLTENLAYSAVSGAVFGGVSSALVGAFTKELGKNAAQVAAQMLLVSPQLGADVLDYTYDRKGNGLNNYILNSYNNIALKSNPISARTVSSPVSVPSITPSSTEGVSISSGNYGSGGIGPAWNTKTYGNTWMQQTYGPSINDGSLNYDSGASFVGDGLSNGSSSVSYFRSGNGGVFPRGMSNGPRAAGFGGATSGGIYGPGIQFAGASSGGGGGRGGGGIASGTPIITIRFDNEM